VTEHTTAAGSLPAEVVLVAGEAHYDLVVTGSDAVQAHVGGGPFNTARIIGRPRQPISFLRRLSTDLFGTPFERMLGSDGVRLDAVVRTDEPTTLALAEIDAMGSARYRFTPLVPRRPA
jgi:fructokinase